ncbi:MAG: c-type cytochrome [Steroidobacteraceae bacterium]
MAVVRYSIIIGACAFAVTAVARTQGIPPYWAYAINPPGAAAARPADDTPRRVPGSVAAFTVEQVTDLFSAPDWHPDHHGTMPDIVAHGRKPGVFACGYCHLPNGQGRPENAAIAGLPAAYILQQIADFRSGRRRSSEPRHLPTAYMTGVATNASEQEVQTAAEYFSRLNPQPWIRVVETSSVQKTQVSGWMLVASGAAGLEPIGERIIETPENLDRTELRDDASGFVAYVPVGSIKQGASLVATGGSGKTLQCSICHGPDLKGLGNVPSIAGRSPSYVVRQLYDIQHGTRAGVAAELMKAPVAKLTLADMVSIAAYTASLRP